MRRSKVSRSRLSKPSCGCPHRRDAAPPSSRRVGPSHSGGYRFAVTSALIRDHRMTDARAGRLTHRWQRLVETRMRAGKSPASTAEHVQRFEAQGIAPLCPTHAPSSQRDPRLDKKALHKEIDKDLRNKDREKIRALNQRLKLSREGIPTLRSVRAQCKADRLAALERARQIRAKAKTAAQAERQAAKSRCSLSVHEVRTHRHTAASLRAELKSERKAQADLRRIKRSHSARLKGLRKIFPSTHRAESDDEVRQNIAPELVPLFNRVRRAIRGTPRESRTEAFLRYAEEHPREAYAGSEEATNALVRDLERQQRAGRRA